VIEGEGVSASDGIAGVARVVVLVLGEVEMGGDESEEMPFSIFEPFLPPSQPLRHDFPLPFFSASASANASASLTPASPTSTPTVTDSAGVFTPSLELVELAELKAEFDREDIGVVGSISSEDPEEREANDGAVIARAIGGGRLGTGGISSSAPNILFFLEKYPRRLFRPSDFGVFGASVIAGGVPLVESILLLLILVTGNKSTAAPTGG